MSKEELLKPRIKCIKDYLGRIFQLNEVIPLVFKKEYNEWAYEDCSHTILLSTFESLDQFKKLEWHEERKYFELPEYIKWSPDPNTLSFLKVENWYSNPNTSSIAGVYVENGHRLFIIDCQPATPEEYEQYQTSIIESK